MGIRGMYGIVVGLLVFALIALLLLTPARLLHLAGLGAQAPKIEVRFLTPVRWQLLKLTIGVACIALLSVGVALKHITAKLFALQSIVQQAFREGQQAVAAVSLQVKQMPLVLRLTLFGLFIFLFSSQTYQACRFPLSYDEIWTYLNFSSRGPLVALAYYPAPNNHVLYSLLSTVTVALMPRSEIGLRLPAVLASAIIFWLLFVLLLRWSSSFWAVCGLFLFYSTYIIFYYSFLARGYSLKLLAFVGSLGLVLELLRPLSSYRTLAWLGFVIFSIIGLCTIPTYVYPLASEFILLGMAIVVAVSIDKSSLLKHTLVAGVLIVSATLLFYSPILILSGLQALIGNKYVVALPRTEVLEALPAHFTKIIDSFFVSAVTKFLFLGLLSAALLCALINTKWVGHRNMLWLGIFFLLPVIFMILQSVIPFPRTWIYLVVVLVLVVSWFLNHLTQDIANLFIGANKIQYLLLVGVIILWVVSTYSGQAQYLSDHAYFYSFATAYQRIALTSGKAAMVIDNDNADVMMEYQYRIHGFDYKPFRQHGAIDLPKRVLLIHDKVSKQPEIIRPGPNGQQRIIYDDFAVQVSEITLPVYQY